MSHARSLPRDADLAATVGWLALAWLLALLPVGRTTLLAGAVALGALLVLPGYALVAALFPDADEAAPTGTERLLFGMAASLVIAMGLGVALSVTGVGFSRLSTLSGASLPTLAFRGIAALRRRGQERPFAPDIEALGTWTSWRPHDRALTVGLIAVAVVAVLWIGVLGAGVGGESFSEVYLLTETADGAVAGGYPETIEAGGTATVQVGIENHHEEAITYTVVVVQQRVAPDDPTTVRDRTELDRFRMTVPPGSERIREHTLAPTMAGETRVRYLFYRGATPGTADAASARQHLQLWITVDDTSDTVEVAA